mmetsp:Transcript_17544/g.51345  ORF Transcript_17544/g.51345 Transcript_17544/m.51345 type:complete len:210 (+) Transcript_17544:437-1066(+)
MVAVAAAATAVHPAIVQRLQYGVGRQAVFTHASHLLVVSSVSCNRRLESFQLVELLGILHLCKVHFPSEEAANAAKAAAELGPLLGPVGDELEVGAPGLVHVGEPLDELGLLDNFELCAILGFEVLLVGLLLCSQIKLLLFPCAVVLYYDPVRIEVLPDDQGLHRAEFESIQGVFDHEAVLPRVLIDLVEVLLDQLLLLDEFDTAQRLC